ncbi:hypothetical protein O2W18_01150 [Modestobacter sp. VKM Ac-2983]|uniref:hypothetical protein n=1 Tax=Modestobacter sp. VKM Ac-2983 TaxID=3004137 RepID=UPI0022AB5B3D|nr:hypothetical protein [Modestobacter sp. VKM Ac-2983]MCZ2803707.1 hypothetical protein [Modestobacter sp. VKM Ac-2983]
MNSGTTCSTGQHGHSGALNGLPLVTLLAEQAPLMAGSPVVPGYDGPSAVVEMTDDPSAQPD